MKKRKGKGKNWELEAELIKKRDRSVIRMLKEFGRNWINKIGEWYKKNNE